VIGIVSADTLAAAGQNIKAIPRDGLNFITSPKNAEAIYKTNELKILKYKTSTLAREEGDQTFRSA
jgi:hypothetical protein